MFQTLSNDILGLNLDMFITCTFAQKIQKNYDIIIPKMLMTLSSLSYLPCILTHTLTLVECASILGCSEPLAFNIMGKACQFHNM